MLRMTLSSNAEAAIRYYRDALRTGDYFLCNARDPLNRTDQETIGQWGGKGAARLGLSGQVTDTAFERLCRNLHPATGEKLTPRTKDDRRVGYDINFHCPKSVSLATELGNDSRIVAAFREAVDGTMLDMEQGMKTRVRQRGADETRHTGNFVSAEFVHYTARPVDGVPDPHLHAHCFVFNSTWDPVEKRWKAGEFGDLKRDAPYYQAVFHSRLADNLIRLGYAVERRGDGWELAHIPDSLIKKFSRRTDEIEKLATELGITDPDQKADLGAKTRKRKSKLLSMKELRRLWHERLDDSERRALHNVLSRAAEVILARPDPVVEAARSMEFALRHTHERASVVSEKRLMAEALKHGIGKTVPESVRAETDSLVSTKRLLRATIEDETMVTSPAVLAEEQQTLTTVRNGRGQHPPLKADHVISDTELSAEQRDAVRHVLETTDSVIVLRGRAGVGKTRAMQEVVNAIESMGLKVQVAAPTGMATHEVLRAEGFRNAETSAHVLVNRDLKQKLKGQVLWVDEAGLLSMPDMARLVRLVDECEARLLLTGDTRQHRSVNRGDALRLLESECGIKPAELTEVRRQKRSDYREAVEAISRGDLVKGFTRLDSMGAIIEAEREERSRIIADKYCGSIKRGQSTLVVAPTHLEGNEVTRAIRDHLKSEGHLSKDETAYTRLFNRQLTEAERGDPRNYRKDDVVQFHQNAHGKFRPGDRGRVVGMTEKSVTLLRDRDNELVRVPLHGAKAFQVFEPRELKVAVGDRLRITYGGRDAGGKHRLPNGAIYSVVGIHKNGAIELDNGWKIPKSFGHITHGYAVTSDASQGRTVDHLILAQSDLSSAASHFQQWYVSITRGRHEVTIVTDDKDRLLRAVARDNSRMSATEFMRLAMMPPKERGMKERLATGLWVAKELATKLKEQVNQHLAREQRERGQQRRRPRNRQDQSREGFERGGRTHER